MSEKIIEPGSSEEANLYAKWRNKLNIEKRNYKIFKGIELDEQQLIIHFRNGDSPIETLNSLSTIN